MTKTELTLYELAGANLELRFSPHCWKSRMALAHKGIKAVREPWRYADRDKIAFSGQALVPVLVCRNETISDSWRIALYLEDRFSTQAPLFGGKEALSHARFVNSWADTTLLAAVAKVILVDVYNCLHDNDRDYFRASREKRFGMALEAVVADQNARLRDLRVALMPLRHMLKKQDFIGGEAPVYADYCVFGMFMWARVCSPIDILEPEDPIVSWRDRLLDAFDGLARSAPCVPHSGAIHRT
jgi:glutathione S-transferase